MFSVYFSGHLCLDFCFIKNAFHAFVKICLHMFWCIQNLLADFYEFNVEIYVDNITIYLKKCTQRFILKWQER